jgi:hypothetical protein
MKINNKNKQAIHDVLITDLQRRLFKQYNSRTNEFIVTDEDYDTQQTLLVDRILHLDTMADVNDVLIEYGDLFMDYDSINVFTLDGTLNYMLDLLVKHAELNKCKC